MSWVGVASDLVHPKTGSFAFQYMQQTTSRSAGYQALYMSAFQQMGARTSSWTHLPVNILQLITPLLARDGVASAAKVWPLAVEDQKLKLFVPGGMPICSDCFSRVVSASMPELLKHECEDPTGTIAVLPDNDDVSTFMIQDDIVTLFVGGFLELVCKQPGVGACLLCTHKQGFHSRINSQEWLSLLDKYACRLSSELNEFSNDTFDPVYSYHGSVWEAGLLPAVCPRCGDFDCDHSSNCKWFCGEDRVLQTFQETLHEEHKSKVFNMAPCGCRKPKKSAKGGRNTCACQHCNSAASRACPFCGKCCRIETCYHTDPPEQPIFNHTFITEIAGARPAVPVARHRSI